MPELPEAESIGRALSRVLPGRRIEKVEVFTPAMREPLTPLLTARLEGVSFAGIRRRARYVVADLSDGRALLMHFGMSGVVRVEPEGLPRRKHEHVFLHLSGGLIFKFECTRRFSVLKVCQPGGEGNWPPELSALGVEPLSDAFCGSYLFQSAQRRSCPVKSLLMDNAVVVGIGNIYTAETLFAAGVSPLQPANELTRKQCDFLVDSAKNILRRAIESGGTSIADFINVDGSEGKFKQELLIYGRNGQPCVKCGATICQVKIAGRSSCFCPHCQVFNGSK